MWDDTGPRPPEMGAAHIMMATTNHHISFVIFGYVAMIMLQAH